jgi:hypothetical protein
MGRPQLGLPRLRLIAVGAGGIAIGPDHTPPGVTVRGILARAAHGLREVIGRRLAVHSRYGGFGGDASHGQ